MTDLLRPTEHALRHGRNQSQRHKQAGSQRIEDGKSHVHKELSGDTLGEDDGGKYTDRRQGGCGDGSCHLTCTVYTGLLDGHSLAVQTVDILNNHDGVIHQHTDTQCQTGHGNDIQ